MRGKYVNYNSPSDNSTQSAGIDIEELFKNFQHIDAQEAIAQLDIESSEFIQLLHRFAISHENDPTTLLKLIDSKTWLEAVRTAHTSKGLCKTIGAYTLGDKWYQLELQLSNLHERANQFASDIHQEDAYIDTLIKLIADIEEEHNIIIEFIRKLPININKDTAYQTLNRNELIKELEELKLLISDFNVSALRNTESMIQCAEDEEQSLELNSIRNSLENFDYQIALKKLELFLAALSDGKQ